MNNNIDKYLKLIKYNYFASLYLNGEEFNFNITKMTTEENPKSMAYEFFIDGYMDGKHSYCLTPANPILPTHSFYCVNAPDRKQIFNCQVRVFVIDSTNKDNTFTSWISGRIDNGTL